MTEQKPEIGTPGHDENGYPALYTEKGWVRVLPRSENNIQFELYSDNIRLYAENERLREQCEKLAAALEFYANRDHWGEVNTACYSTMVGDGDHDPKEGVYTGGAHARKALAEHRKVIK